MTKITHKAREAIRTYALERGERYRITSDGEVHIYGKMPNAIDTGWWFAGYTEEVIDLADHGYVGPRQD
jgi:hypothetical protein